MNYTDLTALESFSPIADEPVKVLLVDDDEDDYFITKEILGEISQRRYQLEWTASYNDGLNAIRDDRHDVYIIDYRLGILTGLELISQAITEGIKKPFILLTGQGDLYIDEQAMRIGAIDYLVKGRIDAAQLERSIRHGIEHWQNLLKIQRLNEELEERVRQRTAQLDQAVQELQKLNENLQGQIKEREKAEEALIASQQLYMTIAKNFPDGTISVIDKELKIIFLEGKALKHFKISADLLIGQHITKARELIGLPKINATFDYHSVLDTVFLGEIINLEVPYHDYQFALNIVPLPDGKGEIKQIMIVARNITEQKKAENDIRKSLEKEKELNELKSRFVSMASHEFRTPLSTIMSSVALIARYRTTEEEDKRQKHVARVKSNVINLTQILNDFLSISRLDEGAVSLNLSEFDLKMLFDETIEEMQTVLKTGQKVNYEHIGEKNTTADRQMLKNILINLLSNAAKYSPEGGNIYISTQNLTDTIAVTVKDEGMGIPDADKVHLFSRFFRAENAVNIQGTGLGLHIVKKYAEMMFGKVDFESQINQGTTFYVRLDRQKLTKML